MAEQATLESVLQPPYEALGLDCPEIVWCSDPVEFAATVGAVRFSEAMGRDDLRTPRPDGCGCPECLGIDVTDRVERMLGADTERDRAHILLEAIRSHDRSASGPLEVRAHLVGCVVPSRRLAWGIRSARPNTGRLDALADAWVFTPTMAVMLARGQWRTDDSGRLHDSLDGPALAWGEWQVPFHHGVMLPLWAIDPWDVTIDRILDERNVEVRRSLIERYGLDRFVADNPSVRLLDDDPTRGQLWDLGVRDRGSSVMMVRVVDATPTPSGDRKVYWLRVPPTVRSAHEAVAWTFDIEPDHYEPEVET